MLTKNVSPAVPPQTGNAQDAELAQALDAYLADLEAGRPVDANEVVAAHPAVADRLRACLIGLHQIEQGHDALSTPADAAKPGPRAAQLGDYQLLREVGRGGMGVVYEAEQMSLGRRVALKVLPFAAALDPKQLQRFKTEAQAAAQLHHTNIVPVHAVGCERGVHYYAMQFIEGLTIAALIHQLRSAAGKEGAVATDIAAGHRGPLPAESTVTHDGASEPAMQPPPEPPQAAALTPTLPQQGAAFYGAAARLGVQAAEALEHAHQMGVIHRDIKPANLMVDESGRLWVADFGLARFHGAAGLTLTGDVIGTLRYASPEQLQARPGQIDQRSDVYSLGVTLYELLTLEPAFDAQDREALLVQIMGAEPIPPRLRRRDVPAELETIVLKAMEKNPDDRYATAQELADDLQRFLDDAPIRARRPTLGQRLQRWGRRHRPAVWSAAVCGLLTLGIAAASLGWIAHDRSAQQALIAHDQAVRDGALDDEVRRTLDGAAALLQAGQWPQARVPIEQADQLLAAAGRAARPPRLQDLRHDLAMAERLEDIYSGSVDQEQNAAYASAFRDYGVDLDVLSPAEAAQRIKARTIRLMLVQGLDFWSMNSDAGGNSRGLDRKELRAIAQAADPDPWRQRLRDALGTFDQEALLALAESADVAGQPPATMALLGRALAVPPLLPQFKVIPIVKPGNNPKLQPAEVALQNAQSAEVFLRKAQRQHPGDLWLNIALANYFLYIADRYDEAVRFYTVARTLRPKSWFITYRLGFAHYHRGSFEEAYAELCNALELKPDHLNALMSRAMAAVKLQRPEVVVADLTKVIELRPEKPVKRSLIYLPRRDVDWNPYWIPFYRGSAFQRLGQWDKAIADLTEMIDGSPSYQAARHARAYSYTVLRRWREAADDLTPADFAKAPLNDVWFQVASLQLLQGGGDAYQRLCRQLLERIGQTKDGFTGYQAFLASRTCMLRPAKDPDPKQAMVWAEKAVAAQPKSPWFLHTLALAHYRAGHFEQAVARSQESMKADPKWGGNILNWLVLALAHERLGRADEARKWIDKASSWRDKAALGPGKGEGVCPPDLLLSDWLEFQVLYPEAAAIFKSPIQ
jgi:serine/threonine protein kinase/tetratricopeptide (TPR) repeat protein